MVLPLELLVALKAWVGALQGCVVLDCRESLFGQGVVVVVPETTGTLFGPSRPSFSKQPNETRRRKEFAGAEPSCGVGQREEREEREEREVREVREEREQTNSTLLIDLVGSGLLMKKRKIQQLHLDTTFCTNQSNDGGEESGVVAVAVSTAGEATDRLRQLQSSPRRSACPASTACEKSYHENRPACGWNGSIRQRESTEEVSVW